MMRAAGWRAAGVPLAVVVLSWGLATTLTASPVEAAPRSLACPSNVCQTATGPVGVGPSQKGILAVNNFTDQALFVVIAYIDPTTGKVLAKSEGKVLEPSQGTSFDFDPKDRRVDIIAALRISFIRPPDRGSVAAAFQVFDADTGKTVLHRQLPNDMAPTSVQAQDWQAETAGWADAASHWTVQTSPDWGTVAPR